jgi:osmotically-inducible protein OsmY
MLNSTKSVDAPSSVRRSFEDELLEAIELALRQTGYLELRDVEVTLDGHDVVLRGRVPTYFMKQKAEFVVRSIAGIATLKGEIEVIEG